MRAARPWLSACVMAVVLAASACQTPPKKRPVTAATQEQASNPIDRIQELEDRRALGDLPQLAANDPNPVLRARAYLALGRIQDPTTAPTIAVGISDVAPLPRYEAAFAAGLIGLSWDPVPPETKTLLVDKLLAQEAQEQEAKVHYVQLEALARLATPAAVDRLVERLLGTTPDVQSRAALLLGVAVRQNATIPSKAFTSLAPLIKKESPPESRYGAAYALAAAKNPLARTQLLLCTQDEASEVRAICAKGLGDVGTDLDAVTLRKLLDDSDYRVAVEATRSLAKLAEKCKAASCAPVGALADLSFRAERLERGDVAGGAQPLLALAQAGLPATQGKALLTTLRDRVRAAARNASTPALKADIANIDCRLSAAMDRQLGMLKEVLTCGGDLIPEAKRLAMGITELARTPAKDPAKRVEDIAPYLRHADSSVKLATVNALAENNSPAAIDRLRTLIPSTDLVVAAAAVSALGKLNDQASIPQILDFANKNKGNPDVAESIAESLAALKAKDAEPLLRDWLQIPHAHIRSVAAKALTTLTGQLVMPTRVERAPSKGKPPYLPKEVKVTLKTEKGDIELSLYTADAPLTSSNFYQLAKRGFFKNTTFHRIVPDFVAQGGDPRGDGEGGPGYSIRCEVNHRPYARGVVGMALSGKDTGGSQFFITHSPQPHLDGRYTAFGEVVKGQDVVDQLLEGDKILEVRAQP